MSFRNAEPTNRLLQLYVLHRRGEDDARPYSLVKRHHLGHAVVWLTLRAL